MSEEEKTNSDGQMQIVLKKIDGKENAKTYRIVTVQDIYECLTTENIDNFLKEFEMVARSILLMKSIAKTSGDENNIKFPYFDWIDD